MDDIRVWVEELEPFTGFINAVATLALVGITAWYAKKTRDIAEENRRLVSLTKNMVDATRDLAQATDRMASGTETLAGAASEELLHGAPILTCVASQPRSEASDVRTVWKNIGMSVATHFEFGYERHLDGNVEVRWGADSILHNFAEGQLEVTQSLETTDREELSLPSGGRLAFLARYRDPYANVYLSRFMPGQPLDVRREAHDSSVGTGQV